MFHENFFDLESFLNDLYGRPNIITVKINNVFQVEKESAKNGYLQQLHCETESKHIYKKENTYKGAQRKIRIRKVQTPTAARETKTQG